MKINEYIAGLAIQPGEPYRKIRKTLGVEAPSLPIKEGADQSFFSEKSILSFASQVSAQNRSDVLNTVLLAQMAANKAVNNDTLLWYNKFLEILSKTGWIIEGKDLQTYESNSDLFEIQNVIIDILTSVFGSTYIAIIKKTLDAIKGLSDEDKKIKAFEKNTMEASQSYFQIALATEENTVVAMKLGTFVINSFNNITSVLFFKAEKSKTTVQYISKNATFNSDVFAIARGNVTKMLGENLLINIAEIDI